MIGNCDLPVFVINTLRDRLESINLCLKKLFQFQSFNKAMIDLSIEEKEQLKIAEVLFESFPKPNSTNLTKQLSLKMSLMS